MNNTKIHDKWVLEDLSKSGLDTSNFIIEPLTTEEELRTRLGFASIGNADIMSVGGYWIPYPNVPGYYRLKLRESIKIASGTIKYLSPRDGGNHPYLLPKVKKQLENYSPDEPAFITEGEKKAVKATLEGFPCIGLSGVWCFKDKDNGFIQELEALVWKDRSVYLVFDSDVTEKHGVRQAELRLAIELCNRGANVYTVRLPSETNEVNHA